MEKEQLWNKNGNTSFILDGKSDRNLWSSRALPQFYISNLKVMVIAQTEMRTTTYFNYN